MSDPVTALAVASTVLAGASGVASNQMMRQQKKQMKQEREKTALTEAQERQKQQELSNTYRGMKSHLFSGDNTGIETESLIQ